jgi:hypothetical protein
MGSVTESFAIGKSSISHPWVAGLDGFLVPSGPARENNHFYIPGARKCWSSYLKLVGVVGRGEGEAHMVHLAMRRVLLSVSEPTFEFGPASSSWSTQADTATARCRSFLQHFSGHRESLRSYGLYFSASFDMKGALFPVCIFSRL